jgi:hypothetical protein
MIEEVISPKELLRIQRRNNPHRLDLIAMPPGIPHRMWLPSWQVRVSWKKSMGEQTRTFHSLTLPQKCFANQPALKTSALLTVGHNRTNLTSPHTHAVRRTGSRETKTDGKSILSLIFIPVAGIFDVAFVYRLQSIDG